MRPYILPADFLGSYAKLLEAATDAVSYPVEKDGVEIGNIDFAAQAQVNPGDLPVVRAPAVPDAKAAGLVLGLRGMVSLSS